MYSIIIGSYIYRISKLIALTLMTFTCFSSVCSQSSPIIITGWIYQPRPGKRKCYPSVMSFAPEPSCCSAGTSGPAAESYPMTMMTMANTNTSSCVPYTQTTGKAIAHYQGGWWMPKFYQPLTFFYQPHFFSGYK